MLKNRIIYIILLLGSGFLNYFHNSYVLDVVFFAVLSILPLSILSIFISANGVHLSVSVDKDRFKKKEEGNLRVLLKNEGHMFISHMSFLPYHDFGIYMEDRKVDIPFIPANDSYEHTLTFHANYRGAYTIGLKNIYIRDYFNLIKLKLKKEVSLEVVYFPNLVVSDYSGRHNTISDEEQVYGVDFIEQDVLVDIRDYEYGDPLKKIHWKLSAKNDSLLVKKYSSNKKKKTAVLIDTKRLSKLRRSARIIVEDQIIEKAVSIIFSSLQQKTDVRTVTSVNESQDLDQLASFPGLFRFLAKYQFNHNQSAADMVKSYYLENEEKQLADTNNIFIITNSPTVELYGLLVENQFGNHTFHLYCILHNSQKRDLKLKELISRMEDTGVRTTTLWI